MNPFNWPGPEFLWFYFVFALAVVSASFLVRRARGHRLGSAAFSRRLPMDPYEIAYLRGGPRGALAVAMFSLLGRGLLKEETGILSRAAEPPLGLKAIEHELLVFFSQREYADQALRNETLQAATQEQSAALRRAGLLPR